MQFPGKEWVCTRIAYNNDYSGPDACSNTKHAYLQMKDLAMGTYHVVSEGNTANGDITTTIEGCIASPVVNISKDQNYILIITPTVATGNAAGLCSGGDYSYGT